MRLNTFSFSSMPVGAAFGLGLIAVVAVGNTAQADEAATAPLGELIANAAEGARFPGQVLAANITEIASTLDSIVTEIHFQPEQLVEAGDVLFTLDPTEFDLKVRTAEAYLKEALANLVLIEQEFSRAKQLFERGTVTAVQMEKAQSQMDLAKAKVLLAEVRLDGAQIDLDSATIRAPISGRIGQSTVSVGSFVEAEAGSPLSTVIQLDPILVAYQEPYDEQVRLFAASGLDKPEDFLDLLTVRLEIAGGLLFPETSKPSRVSSAVDETTGTVTVWAEFPNPNNILRPGMRVTVLTELDADKLASPD